MIGGMRLFSFVRSSGNELAIGALSPEGNVIDLASEAHSRNVALSFDPADMLSLVAAGEKALAEVRSLVDGSPNHGPRVEDVHLLAPIPVPRRNVVCVGWNYVAHFEEGKSLRDSGQTLPEHPRDIQQKRHGGQWWKGKSLDGHAPMGPWIVTADGFDWSSRRLVSRVNGVVKQDGNTSQMYFKVPRLLAELATLSDRVEHLGGWDTAHEARRLLDRLGVKEWDRPVAELSGGTRKRVAIARALLTRPDLLLLDEPTNHLDADTVDWLEDEIDQLQGALLLVTHDRYFLDDLVDRIVEITPGAGVTSYPGNYEAYLEQKLLAEDQRELDEQIRAVKRIGTRGFGESQIPAKHQPDIAELGFENRKLPPVTKRQLLFTLEVNLAILADQIAIRPDKYG